MKKLLLIQGVISNYRVPVYNLISEKYDLTVMYSKGDVPEGCNFKTYYVQAYEKGHFTLHRENIRKIAEQYDVVVGMMAFNWISIYMLAFGYRKYKFIPWGIGVPASYSVRYDAPEKKANLFLTKLLIKKSDAAIFYTDYPKEKYLKMGIPEGKMFVAHNTVKVINTDRNSDKDSILFVGTLYKAKSVRNMLEYYKEAYQINQNIPLLRIIGDGDELVDLKKWVEIENLQDKIILEGSIYEENILAKYFSQAYACVSLGQAGLSVQKAMGYGVPFVTTVNAYTGGERLDIQDGINGVLIEKEVEFNNILLDIAQFPKKYIIMGNNAYEFYQQCRTIEQMADGVFNAIHSVM